MLGSWSGNILGGGGGHRKGDRGEGGNILGGGGHRIRDRGEGGQLQVQVPGLMGT